MKNILPKILVIIGAIVLWLLIVSGQEYVAVIELPLSVYEPRPEMTLGEALPKTVKVRVEGPGRILYFQKWSTKYSLILDVGTITHNQRLSLKSYFKERPNQVMIQSELNFLEIVYPDSIDIYIDNKISKEVPAHIISDISVKPGYIQVGIPETGKVTLSGPKKYLKSVDYVVTKSLEKENVDLSFSSKILVVNPNIELVKMTPQYVDVQFNIEMIGERLIPNIPIKVRNQPNDLEIQFIPNSVSLRITGGNNQIQTLTERDFFVYFDYLTQWFPNKNYYSVKIKSPDEVLDIIHIIPEQIEVIVIKKNQR